MVNKSATINPGKMKKISNLQNYFFILDLKTHKLTEKY